MFIMIKIPDSEISDKQSIIDIPFHFIDKQLCEAGGYEFSTSSEVFEVFLDSDYKELSAEDKAIKILDNVYIYECPKTKNDYHEYLKWAIDQAITALKLRKECCTNCEIVEGAMLLSKRSRKAVCDLIKHDILKLIDNNPAFEDKQECKSEILKIFREYIGV